MIFIGMFMLQVVIAKIVTKEQVITRITIMLAIIIKIITEEFIIILVIKIITIIM